MPNIQAILHKESSNTHHIFFYREGVFYKAYERSAYLFVTNYKPFMVKKRFVKAAGREIVSIGFPTNSINSYLPKDQLHENGNEVEISLNVSPSPSRWIYNPPIPSMGIFNPLLAKHNYNPLKSNSKWQKTGGG